MSEAIDNLRAALADRYRIDRELGRGGMAIVYLAEDVKHNRPVALKVLRPELSAVVGTDRFLREIEIAARLQHPHILPLHDSGEAGGLLYYVMPFVDGESLRGRLEREGALPWKEAIGIACEVASALQYAHSQGIIHRDIKPGNILLSQGHAVVADFGIARAVRGTGDDHEFTKLEFAVGTPAYMSPEQALSDPELDGRSDVYSLGCVLYEMLTGVAPADAHTTKSSLLRDTTPNAARFKSGVKHQVPKAVRGATAAALARDPRERYQTASEMRDTLVQSLRGGGSPTRFTAQLVGTAAIILALVYFLSLELGLPDWVFQALALVTGIQIAVLIMASRSEQAGVAPRRLSRKRIQIIGATAVVLVGLASGLYMAGTALGIGPGRGLLGAGTLEARERIILVDFENRTTDSLLGVAATEAFRIDFAQSPVVTVVEPDFVRQVLTRMERPPNERLTVDMAREIALREGIKAVVTGEITSVGNGYMLTSRVVAAEDAQLLLAERVSASSSDEVIAAIDKLSAATRRGIGESLRTIRRGEPLQRVTTSSLPALRKYSQASHAIDAGDLETGRSLLEAALELDSTFAMAHRRLGLISLSRAEQVRALSQAYRHRDRLTDREQGITTAAYHLFVTGDDQGAITALEMVLAQYPTDPTALVNLGLAHAKRHEFAKAEPYYKRALDANPHSPGRYAALVEAQTALGKTDDARQSIERLGAEFPDHPMTTLLEAQFATVDFAYDRADSIVAAFLRREGTSPFWRAQANTLLAASAFVRGRVVIGEQYLANAIETFERLDVPAAALSGEIQLALVNLLLLGQRESALRRTEAALRQYPLSEIDPLNRPYLQVAELYAFARDADRATSVLDEFDSAIEQRGSFAVVETALRGLITLADSNPTDAIELLTAASEQGCRICLLPYLGAAYDEAGEPDSTVRFLEEYLSSTWIGRVAVDVVSLGYAYERLARNYELTGNRAQAAKYYEWLVALWSNADPELQTTVAEARAAVRRLLTDDSS